MTIAFKHFGAATNPAVVLLHPFPFSGKVLYQSAGLVAQSGFYVVVPDLPGFGRSEIESGAAHFELLAVRVAELLDDLEISTAVIGGVSLGGYVALSFLRQFAHRVSGLILIDTKASADEDQARANRLRVAAQMREAPRLGLLAEQMLPNLVSAASLAQRPGLAMAIETEITQADPLAIAWMQEAMAQRPDSLGDLATFDGPTLLVRGDADALCTAQDFAAMQSASSNPIFIELESIGHLPNVEAPEQLARTISDWLVRA